MTKGSDETEANKKIQRRRNGEFEKKQSQFWPSRKKLREESGHEVGKKKTEGTDELVYEDCTHPRR